MPFGSYLEPMLGALLENERQMDVRRRLPAPDGEVIGVLVVVVVGDDHGGRPRPGHARSKAHLEGGGRVRNNRRGRLADYRKVARRRPGDGNYGQPVKFKFAVPLLLIVKVRVRARPRLTLPAPKFLFSVRLIKGTITKVRLYTSPHLMLKFKCKTFPELFELSGR